MTKIAITGEGSTDYGKKDYRTEKWLPGPAILYADNIVKEQKKEVEFVPIERKEVEKIKLQGRSIKGLQGKGVPARKFKILMHKRDCDAGIYYCDADKENGVKSSNQAAVNKHYERVYEEVAAGLDCDRAIPMIPLSMIECWLLGDKAALEQVFKISIHPNQMPSKPEYIWGAKSEPDSDYPKNYFVRLIRSLDKRYRTYESSQDDFDKIAQCSVVSTLRKKCFYSYERFYKDFVELLEEL